MKINRRKMVIVVVVLLLLCIAIPCTYAVYQGKIDIGATATTGGFACDIVVDTDENYIENNEAYFFVTVNNWKQDGAKTIITDADVDYNLIIENQNGSVGLFRYVDDDGNTNGKGESTVNVSNYLGKTKSSRRYKVYVTSTTNLKANVSFKVKLDAKQRNMG